MKSLLFIPVLLCLSINLNAQVAIGNNNASPDSSAMLDVQSTDKGLLIPRMTSVERMAISTPAAGLLLYQTDGAKGLWFYDGAAWMVGSVFTLVGDTISNGNGEYSSNDFVIGSASLDYDGNLDHRNRMFFDKSKGAFRAGLNDGDSWDADSIGNQSFASGRNTKATGSSSTAMGSQTEASGLYSTSMGFSTEAIGNYSTAIGRSTDAIAENSLAAGYFTDAIGMNSTAIGNQTTASGTSSTAIGHLTYAAGAYSTAMGYITKANGLASTSIGYFARANGKRSTAIGNGVKANGFASTAIGIYNDTIITPEDFISDTTPLFIIGNGSIASPSNAMVVRKDGRVGIGISAPHYHLHVGDGDIAATNNSDTRIAVTDSTNGQSAAFVGLAKSNDGTPVEAQLMANGNTSIGAAGVYIGSVSSHRLRFTTGGQYRMEITTSGNVGINSTSTPNEDLVVGKDLGEFLGTSITIGDSDDDSGLNIGEDIYNFGFVRWNNGFNHLNFGTRSSTDTYSNTLVIKNGKIGVKNTSPIYDLHVGNGNISATNASNTRMAVADNDNGQRAAVLGLAKTSAGAKVEAQLEANGSTNAGPSVIIGASTTHPVYLRTGNATRMTISTTGNVGIGTLIPAYKLEVNGNAAKTTGASWINTSDRRLKNDVCEYEAGLTDVLRIRPVKFHYNQLSGYDVTKEHVGVIAQDLQKISPYMIGSIVKDGVEYLTVNNSAMTYMLINAVQELHAENEKMKSEIDNLRSLRDDFDKLLARLDDQIGAQE